MSRFYEKLIYLGQSILVYSSAFDPVCGCSKDTKLSENDFIFLKCFEKFSLTGINYAIIIIYIQST